MEEKRNNRAVERKLKEALKHDRARIQVGRISHFGLMEMSRQRIRTGVLESSTETCPHLPRHRPCALGLLGRAADAARARGDAAQGRDAQSDGAHPPRSRALRAQPEARRICAARRALRHQCDDQCRRDRVGAQAFTVERGEQVHSAEAARELAAQHSEALPPLVDEADAQVADEYGEEPATSEPSEVEGEEAERQIKPNAAAKKASAMAPSGGADAGAAAGADAAVAANTAINRLRSGLPARRLRLQASSPLTKPVLTKPALPETVNLRSNLRKTVKTAANADRTMDPAGAGAAGAEAAVIAAAKAMASTRRIAAMAAATSSRATRPSRTMARQRSNPARNRRANHPFRELKAPPQPPSLYLRQPPRRPSRPAGARPCASRCPGRRPRHHLKGLRLRQLRRQNRPLQARRPTPARPKRGWWARRLMGDK